MGPDVFAVVARPLSADDIAAWVDDPGAGGVVIFSGIVRNETDGRPVKFLEYEAHAPMAEAKMREIGAAIRARWSGVKRIAMLHRIGRLEIASRPCSSPCRRRTARRRSTHVAMRSTR